MSHPRSTRPLLLSLALAAVAGCSTPGKKPTDADIAGYLAQSEPTYLRVGGVKPSFEAVKTLGSNKVPDGSWRVQVDFTLHAGEDLYAPSPESHALRTSFDQAVIAFEEYRVARIAGVERLGMSVGLMKQGDAAPEPALAVSVATRANQDVADHVTLLAQPDGAGWKFFQLDAQALSDDVIGAPLATLRQSSPRTVFVVAGSAEDRVAQEKARRFLAVLAKAPKL